MSCVCPQQEKENDEKSVGVSYASVYCPGIFGHVQHNSCLNENIILQ